MMKRLILLLALVGTPAMGAEIVATFALMTGGNAVVTLTDTPCSNATVLTFLKPEKHQFYQAGNWKFPERAYELCWRVSSNNQQVWIMDEEGEAVQFPLGAFAPKESI
mgnify:CR=1 FL=1